MVQYNPIPFNDIITVILIKNILWIILHDILHSSLLLLLPIIEWVYISILYLNMYYRHKLKARENRRGNKNMDNPDTSNIGFKTQNKDKRNKKHNTENYKDEQQRPPPQSSGWTQVFVKGKQFMFLMLFIAGLTVIL